MASSIRFERCTFRRMGASALGFYAGVTDSAIIGNVFEDIGGNGISDDLYHSRRSISTRRIRWCATRRPCASETSFRITS